MSKYTYTVTVEYEIEVRSGDGYEAVVLVADKLVKNGIYSGEVVPAWRVVKLQPKKRPSDEDE
jgi:hypothetical protein